MVCRKSCYRKYLMRCLFALFVFGRPVSVEQLVEEDDGLPYRYGGCVAAVLFLIVIVRRREGAA